MSILYSFIFMVLWGSGSFFVKDGLRFATSLDFLILRVIVALGVIVSIALVQRKTLRFPTTCVAWFQVVLTGLLLQFFYQYFFFQSLETNMSPGLLMIILGTQPIFTAFCTNEKMYAQQWIAISIALSGLILIVFNSIFEGHISTMGVLFAILALIGMTVGSILQNIFCRTYSLTANLLIQYTVSLLAFYATSGFHAFAHFEFQLPFLLPLLWMSVVISVIAIYIYYFLISSKKLTRVTMIFYGVPVVAALCDYLFLGHVLSISTMIGMLLTFIGFYLAY